MLAIVAICITSLLVYLFLRKNRQQELNNVHCLVTGGSSGIGLALAIQVVKFGGNVTIIARSKERLASAKELIMAEVKSQDQKVLSFSADISQDIDGLKDIVDEAEKESGPINLLINCAGTSVCHSFLETPVEEFSRMFDVNYLGSVHMTRAVLPSMQRQKCGTIVFVSSVAGLMGLYGYTAYSASKFALLGLAESLQMEIKPYNISITVAFPPDTDTPGFAEEIKNKPIETVRISESSGLYSAEQVASTILRDSLNKKFMSAMGFDGYIISSLCSGMTPVRSLVELVFQVLTMGLFRLASVLILFQCDKIVQQCAIEKENDCKEKEVKSLNNGETNCQ